MKNFLNHARTRRLAEAVRDTGVPWGARLPVLILLFIIHTTAMAQFAGWPSASTNAEIDVINKTVSTEENLDDNRARVTSATQTSTSPVVYELNIDPPTGKLLTQLVFPTGKWCIVIQMEDPTANYNTGKHCRVKVLSYNSGSGVLEVEVESGNTWPSLTFTTDSRVQVQRVPVFWNLDLNAGGKLTCEAYNHDDGTGGIAAVVVGNQLNFNGGIITAAGKGYHYDWVNSYPELGAGGQGTSAPPYNGLGGGWQGGPWGGPISDIFSPGFGLMPPQGDNPPIGLNNTLHGYLCSSNPGRSINDFFFNTTNPVQNGFDGDAADNNLNPGTNTDLNDVIHYDPSNPAASSKWGVLLMGDAGNPGIEGGNGGGGGGFGGTGGRNSDQPNLAGSPGTTGIDGGYGGAPGEGARGGGILLLKMNSYSIASTVSSTKKFLFVDGENGQNAEKGENGGDGGDGGLGGDGYCKLSQIVVPGGTGGFGESGIGAKGGEGGSGGKSGTLWIMKRNSGVSLANHASYRGGFGGGGGSGGYSLKYLTLPLAKNYVDAGSPTTIDQLPCNGKSWYFCPPPPPPLPTIEVCDCEEVFRHIGEDMGALSLVQNTAIPWEISGSSSSSVFYDDDHHSQPVLYYFDGNIRYNCYMYRNAMFKIMMEKMFAARDLETYVPASGTNYKIPVDASLYNPLTKTVKLFAMNHEVLYFEPKVFPIIDRLTDLDDPNKAEVISGNCYYNFIVSGSSGGGGGQEPPPDGEVIVYQEKTGDDGADGNDAPNGNTPDNFFEEDNAPLIIPKDKYKNGLGSSYTELTELVQVIQDNEGKATEIQLLSPENGAAEYALYSTNGQLIQEGSIEISLDLQSLSPGVYFIHIQSGVDYDRRKIVIW